MAYANYAAAEYALYFAFLIFVLVLPAGVIIVQVLWEKAAIALLLLSPIKLYSQTNLSRSRFFITGFQHSFHCVMYCVSHFKYLCLFGAAFGGILQLAYIKVYKRFFA